MSQKSAILTALQAGEKLTGMQALNRFRCATLAQRVSELRSEGRAIKDDLIPNVPGGRKRIAIYWMEV